MNLLLEFSTPDPESAMFVVQVRLTGSLRWTRDYAQRYAKAEPERQL